MDVESDITALYALPLEEFVAARNALAKRAKSEASAELAASIKALRKPTTTAWLANQLARERADTVDELVGLGEQMRAATDSRDGDRLRELAARRKELVDELLTAAAALARTANYGMSDDVSSGLGETFHAAVADPDAGAELRAGRLSKALQNVGFGPVSGSGEAAEVISLSRAREARNRQEPAPAASRDGTGGTGTRTRSTRTEPDQPAEESPQQAQRRRMAEAQAEFEEAQSAVEAADDRVDDLTAELDRRRKALEDAEATVESLEAKLKAARAEAEDAKADVDAGRHQLDQAEVDAEAARSRRREIKQRLARLRDDRLGRT